MNKQFVVAVLLAIGMGISACGGSDKPAAEGTAAGGHEGEHEHEETDGRTASLTEAQVRSIGIRLGNIEQKQLTASLKANGVLQVPNQNKASIGSVYSGIIHSLLVQPGNAVSKGQVIATIANPDFIRLQEEYLTIHSKIGLAELEYNRQRELNEGNAGALKNLQNAATELGTLRTRQQALQQQLRLMSIDPAGLSNGKLVSVVPVRSPISGVVSNVQAKMGSYVDLSTVIAEIVDNSQLHLDLFVYEKDLHRVRNNQEIHFTLTNNPGREYDAQIYSLGSSFEGESKAVTVHAKVKGDKSGLIDGMNVTAIVSLDKATVPAVPTEAIVNVQGQDYIFVLTGSHEEKESAGEKTLVFEKVAIARGTTDVGYTEITLLKPLPEGAQIVVKGAFFVLAAMTNAGEGEHKH